MARTKSPTDDEIAVASEGCAFLVMGAMTIPFWDDLNFSWIVGGILCAVGLLILFAVVGAFKNLLYMPFTWHIVLGGIIRMVLCYIAWDHLPFFISLGRNPIEPGWATVPIDPGVTEIFVGICCIFFTTGGIIRILLGSGLTKYIIEHQGQRDDGGEVHRGGMRKITALFTGAAKEKER